MRKLNSLLVLCAAIRFAPGRRTTWLGDRINYHKGNALGEGLPRREMGERSGCVVCPARTLILRRFWSDTTGLPAVLERGRVPFDTGESEPTVRSSPAPPYWFCPLTVVAVRIWRRNDSPPEASLDHVNLALALYRGRRSMLDVRAEQTGLLSQGGR